MKRKGVLSWCILLLLAGSGWGIENSWRENMTDQQFQEADGDRDGQLTFEEYDTWRERHYNTYRRQSYEIFHELDQNEDGLISSEEIEQGRDKGISSEEP